jgi:mannose-6-phosphate isomerase-like protein (cupin superfamily)
MPKWHRSEQMNDVAPDGAEIRNLIHHPQGATRLGLAEALVPPGASTAKVYHRTNYEEIWYILRGTGVMHLHQSHQQSEEVFAVEADDAVLIPPGHGFWVENTGSTDLVFLCCGSPPWPGADEAQPWPPSAPQAERAEGA